MAPLGHGALSYAWILGFFFLNVFFVALKVCSCSRVLQHRGRFGGCKGFGREGMLGETRRGSSHARKPPGELLLAEKIWSPQARLGSYDGHTLRLILAN